MRLKFNSSFLILFSVLVLVSCQEKTNTLTEPTFQATSASASAEMAIQAAAFNYFSSGLPNMFPSVAIIVNGTVQAFRDGPQSSGDALSAISAGELVIDEEDRRQQIQTALDKFLALENTTLAALTDSQKNVVLFFSAGKNPGECPPCETLFSPFEASTMIGIFNIKKVVVAHR